MSRIQARKELDGGCPAWGLVVGVRAAATGYHSQVAFRNVLGGFGLTVKGRGHHRHLGPGGQGC